MILMKLHRRFLSIIIICTIFSSLWSAFAKESISLERDDIYYTQIIKYNEYLNEHNSVQVKDKQVNIDVLNFSRTENAELEKVSDFESNKNVLKWSNQTGLVEWLVNVEEDGLYSINIEYFPLEAKGREIELQVSINGEVPFEQAGKISLSRAYKDKNEILKDSRDNELRPAQVEEKVWQNAWFRDKEGLVGEPFVFYFKKGINTLSLKLLRESLAISEIKLAPYTALKSYDEMKKGYNSSEKNALNNEIIYIPAEKAYLKSDPTLYPITDRTSTLTQPYSVSKIRMNTIGGYNFRNPSQWISWKFDVSKAGYYKIDMRVKQNKLRGLYSSRRIYIDGVVPNSELDNIRFNYNRDFYIYTLKDNDEDMLFYFDKGEHEIKMEAIVGDIGQTISQIDEAIYSLNSIYRKIIMITGTTVDIYRDYELDKEIPELIPEFNRLAKVLEDQAKKVELLTGNKGTEVNTLIEFSNQIKSLANKPDTINERLEKYKSNIATLSAWSLKMREQPLEIDYIRVVSPDVKRLAAMESITDKIGHEIKAFFASFFEDYDTIGDVIDNKNAVDVWIGLGRDQAQAMKRLIDDTFTPEYKVPIKLSLVQGGLLEATMAGRGPDVAFNVARNQVVDLATRDALVNLDNFSGFKDVLSEFYSGAEVPYVLKNKTYALPETQDFNMLFYRKDIFSELKLKIPQTWDELRELIPVIASKNMTIGIPNIVPQEPGQLVMVIPRTLPTLLLQNGTNIYSSDFTKTTFDTETSIKIFNDFTDFYKKYGLPIYYEFSNRFRTGEMPFAITTYSNYNYLTVSAPEIRNLWGMVPIPGIKKSNGKIDRSEEAYGSGAVMFSKCKNKEDAFEILKWWASSNTQAEFGREMESLIGAGARYITANKIAFEKIAWSYEDAENIKKQWEFVKEIKEIPGGYFVGRHLNNAFIEVVYDGKNSREMLQKYNKYINDELSRKQTELGLIN